MESIQLVAFYQSVTKWPSSEGELDTLAEKISSLLGAPFVAILRADVTASTPSSVKTAFRILSPDTILNSDMMVDYVRRKVAQAEELFPEASGASPQVRQVQLHGQGGEDVPWRMSPEISQLSLVNISIENQPALSGNRSSRSRQHIGWVLVGTPRALNLKDELLLLAVAQRLSALAEVSLFEAGIQLRNQFMSIASHELKTPLTSIYGILQLQERMLRLKKEEPPEQAQERQASYLKMVIRQVRRLNELIDGLLDVSRIQAGRFMVEPSDTDAAALVRDMASSRLSVIAQEAGVKLNLEVPQTLHAWLDPVRTEEVVTNLVMNAIRFSPEGGVIWIRLRDDNGMVRLTVRDQGPSVPVEDRERIFQPFERAQRTSRFGGLGLGLFISRQIAQLHGGNVGLIESLPGRGNVFEAVFPIRSSSVPAASA